MQWLIGILGGLVGGSLTLTAGALNDARTARRERRARIHQLAAVVINASKKMTDSVMQTQVQRMEHADTHLDWAAIHAYELEQGTAFVELSWLVQRSPLWPLLEAMESARAEVVRRWALDHPRWTEIHDRFIAAAATFDGAVQYFVRLNAGQARDYLRSSTLPSPATLGARPPKLNRRFGHDFP